MEITDASILTESSGIIANRGIDGYAESFGMSRNEFLDWVSSKKRILDIGAGGGMLKQEIDILKREGLFTADTEIVPFDISYATREGVENAEYATLLGFTRNSVTETREKIMHTQRDFKKSAVAGTFRNLPFANNTFDGVLAGFSYGVSSLDKEQLMSAYKETSRVLDNRNGSGFISVAVSDFESGQLNIVGSPINYAISDINYLHPTLHKTQVKANEYEKPVTAYFLEVKSR